jgi:hypothetical protein
MSQITNKLFTIDEITGRDIGEQNIRIVTNHEAG